MKRNSKQVSTGCPDKAAQDRVKQAALHPANTYAVVDALIRANRDFDLLILANASHRLGDDLPYFVRRRRDYFVTHLLGGEPPQGYAVGQGAER